MFRHHALCGVSIMAIHLAWIAPAGQAYGQGAEPTALPPVNVEAPREAAPKPAAQRPRTQGTSARRQVRPPSMTLPAPSAVQSANVTPSEARANLNQAPNGQTYLLWKSDDNQFGRATSL